MNSGSSEQFEQRYVERQFIGQGSFGEVYRYFDRILKRHVAIKMPSGDQQEGDSLRKFREEASHLAALDHPNIVRIHNLGEFEGVPYLDMEYVEGKTLERLLEERRQLNLQEARDILRQVCDALAYAHNKKGIVHCDLKPANILIGSSGKVKVTDFGLARAIALSRMEIADTLSSRDGALLYKAPELRNNPSAQPTFASDQYSLAAIAFEMLTGRTAFAAQHTPSQLEPAIPQVVSRVIMRGLAPDPQKRFASVEEFYSSFAVGVPLMAERKTMSVSQAVLWTSLALILLLFTSYFPEADDWMERIANILSVIGALIVVVLWIRATFQEKANASASANADRTLARNKTRMPWYGWLALLLLVSAGIRAITPLTLNGVAAIQSGLPAGPFLPTPTSTTTSTITPTETPTPTPSATFAPIVVTIGPDQFLSAPAGIIPLNGRGESHDTIEILLENTLLNSTRVAEDGTWSTQITMGEAGSYVLQVKELTFNNILRKTHSIQLTVAPPTVLPTEPPAPTLGLSSDTATPPPATLTWTPTATPSPSVTHTPLPPETATNTATPVPVADLLAAVETFQLLEKEALRWPGEMTRTGLANAAGGQALEGLMSTISHLQREEVYQELEIQVLDTQRLGPEGSEQWLQQRQIRTHTTFLHATPREWVEKERCDVTIEYELLLNGDVWIVQLAQIAEEHDCSAIGEPDEAF